jgi:hypothetical protein
MDSRTSRTIWRRPMWTRCGCPRPPQAPRQPDGHHQRPRTISRVSALSAWRRAQPTPPMWNQHRAAVPRMPNVGRTSTSSPRPDVSSTRS